MKLPIFDFSDPEFLTQGWGLTSQTVRSPAALWGAMLLFVYSTQGYYMTTAYGGSSKMQNGTFPLFC